MEMFLAWYKWNFHMSYPDSWTRWNNLPRSGQNSSVIVSSGFLIKILDHSKRVALKNLFLFFIRSNLCLFYLFSFFHFVNFSSSSFVGWIGGKVFRKKREKNKINAIKIIIIPPLLRSILNFISVEYIFFFSIEEREEIVRFRKILIGIFAIWMYDVY